MFNSLEDFTCLLDDQLPVPNRFAQETARRRQLQLTKPNGSLGRLEELVLWFAGWRHNQELELQRPATLVFAGNHGVTAQGVSLYPQDVTAQMIANFAAGGAAINAIASSMGSNLEIIPIRIDEPTGDITIEPAMTDDGLLDALNIGAAAIASAGDLFAFGEMGIGNTTVAAALAASSFGGSGKDWVGPGTGLDRDGIAQKSTVIDRALARHSAAETAVERLRCLGGRELAAIAGAVLAARRSRIPVILDGFVATAAIAPLFAENPSIVDHCIAGHVSAEPGHRKLLKEMKLKPILDLGMRLGEGTGATLAIGILKAAIATHNGMSTFQEAGVSGPEGKASQ